MTRERHSERIARVEMMAGGDSTWDLSDNDCEALMTVLAERMELLRVLREIVSAVEIEGASKSLFQVIHNAALDVIRKAEGR